MDPNDRRLYAQILAQVLIADGVLADAERDYLYRVMDRIGLPPEERGAALSEVSVDSPLEDRIGSLSESARKDLQRELTEALMVDGELSNSEKHLLSRVRALLS